MADQNYPGADDESEPSDNPQEESQEGDENTALLPKSFFGDKDLKAGNQCTVEIVRTYEDEVEVKYIKHGEEKEEQGEPHSDANDKISAMGTEMGSDNSGEGGY